MDYGKHENAEVSCGFLQSEIHTHTNLPLAKVYPNSNIGSPSLVQCDFSQVT